MNPFLNVVDACPTNSKQVLCIYLQRGLSQSAYNKEHIWPQSHGCSNSPQQGDLHHLRACDTTMNSTRGNKDFDNCQGKSGATERNGCYYTSTAWDPPDAAKRDIARAVLYMDVRYEGMYGQANLTAVDSTGTSGNNLGKLSTLIAWNEADPPDDFERRRNELIYTTYQGNRNPFIDHPDWARAVFDPSNYVPAVVEWTVSGTVEGAGWVNGEDGAFSAEVTNGTAKTFFVQPDSSSHYHIGSISWNGALVPQAYYTNAAYYNYTTPAVTNHSTLAVVFAPDLAALGTPIPWLAQYGTNAASVAQEDWDAAELEDWNDDGVANWEEYLAGSDPTAFRLRQVTGVTVGGETTDGFMVGWTAVANAEGYRVRVCSTAVVEAATAGFEGGEVDSGWTVSGMGTTVAEGTTGGAMDGTYVLRLSAEGAWVCSPVVESPAAVEFKYKRSSSTAEWALAVEVGEEGSGSWQTVATVADATTAAQTAYVELQEWRGRRASVRLRDARTGGSTARYVDSVTVRTSGATVAEGTTAATTWTATGLADGTGYDVYVRGEATTPEEAAGPWSEAVRATTEEVVDTRAEQSISFPEIADQTVGATVVLGATATSGLAVAYAVSGPATISGTTLTCTGAGTVTVTASQAGNADWKPAESVTRTFEVAALVLDAPENAWASATNAAGFTAEWSAVAGATGYELEVWKDGTGEDGGTESETVLLSTDFASINGNGNTTLTNGFIEGWTCLKAYGGTNEIRVGSSSAVGWVKAPALDAAGMLRVVTRARAWSGDTNAVLWVNVTGCASQGNTLSAESAVFTNDFENVAGAVTVCWSNGMASKQRFFLEEVSVTELSAGAGGGGGAVPVPGYDPLEVTGTSWAVTGLEAATAYGFHVRATAGTAEGMWSDAVGVTTLAADGEKLPQSIAFPEIGAQVATNTLVLGATASSGLPVAYTVTGNAVETNGILSFTGAGTVTVTASQPGNEAWEEAASVTRTFAVEKAEQDIDFAQIPGTVEETATVALSATADSELPVTFRVEEGPAVLDAATGTLTFTGTGTVEVTARQEGNALWEAALPAWQTFQVVEVELPAPTAAWASATNEAGFTAAWSPVAGATGYELTVWRVTETGEGGEESATVLVADICPDISGNGNDRLNNGNPAGWVYTNAYAATNEIRVGTSGAAGSATVTGVGATGTVRVVTRARKWEADSAVEMRVAVGGAVQTNAVESASATFTNDFEGVEGEVAVMWSGAGSRKRFFLESVEVSVIGAGGSGGVVREVVPGYDGLAVAGTEQAVAGLEAETAYEFQVRAVAGTTPGAGSEVVSVTTLAAEPELWPQSIDFTAVGDRVATDIVTLSATASSGLAVSYTVEGPASLAGNVLTFTGAGTVSVTANQAGNDEWAPTEDVTQTFAVVKAAQSIDFPALTSQSVGDTVTLNAAANSGLIVNYTVSGPATLENGVLTCTGAGTVTVTASQNGNDLYEAATPVERSFVVSLVPQTIDFATIGNQTATATVPLFATASSGLAVSFAVTGGPAVLDGSSLTFTGAGEVTVTATQAGSETYASATATQTFTVSKASQSIDFPALTSQSVGDTVTLNATAGSGLTVSYTVSGPATLEGDTLTCTGEGTVTVTASQEGDDLYAAADDVVRTFDVEEAKTPEETAYEAWLRGLGLDAATYPMGDTGANGHGNWQNYLWDIAPTNTLGLEITGMAAANGNLVLTVPMASERRNYIWVWWTALETGKNPLDDATEVPLGPGAPTMTIPNALPDGGFGLLQATIPE